MTPPAKYESKNLLIRKLQKADAQEIFDNYASQADILDYVSWKPHQTLEDTYQFLDFAQKSMEPGKRFQLFNQAACRE